MAIRSGIALLGALLMAGCATPYSPVPLATNYPTSNQAKAQAAAHWMAITSHIEKTLLPTLKGTPSRSLYVAPGQASAFNQAVRGQLITALVQDGQLVSKHAGGALTIDIDTQVVEFSRHRPQYKFSGERSAIAAGAWVITGIDHTNPWLATVAIAGYDAYSWFHSQFAPGPTPKTEIIVTVSVSDAQRYIARSTSVYYVTDSDRNLYGAADGQATTKTFMVQGG
ncbi:hypothetical protein [Massilia soli]|uniref:FlgO domain-containing protein n=1 Tax=Massilia soli TaxID=2792854 RepID=A0ABS7SM06_9BURK|nr:hypothetical protein [Massilia soli]MBZ2207205.1 hypothetical protein [Massilia soli]